jgi:hypothetical protein
MEWPVEYTDEFGDWWDTLTEAEQIRIDAHVRKLEQRGPKPLRVFYAFDPRRMAIPLIGGDKTGDRRFYEQMIPVADALYDQHLAGLKKEKNHGR